MCSVDMVHTNHVISKRHTLYCRVGKSEPLIMSYQKRHTLYCSVGKSEPLIMSYHKRHTLYCRVGKREQKIVIITYLGLTIITKWSLTLKTSQVTTSSPTNFIMCLVYILLCILSTLLITFLIETQSVCHLVPEYTDLNLNFYW